MLVVDECHRAGSPENAKALAGSYRCTLGLSATPQRQYDSGMIDYVIPAIGPVIFTYDIADAEQDGVLAPFELINAEVSLLSDEQTEYDQLTQRIARSFANSNGDPSEATESLLRLRARLVNGAQMRVPATIALAERYRGRRMIIFHEEIASADRIVRLLQERHHAVTTYHSHLGTSIRRDNLRLFRRGVFDTLVCCRALDEGINVPEVSVAIIASATASQRQRIQRLGRVLRPAPGKSEATIVTLYATDLEAERLAQEEERLADVAQVTWMRAG